MQKHQSWQELILMGIQTQTQMKHDKKVLRNRKIKEKKSRNAKIHSKSSQTSEEVEEELE